MSKANASPMPAPSLAWLADAPLYIDSERVSGFYDAVVRPEGVEEKITLEFSKATADKISGKASGEIGFSLTQIFPFLTAKVSAEIAGESTETNQDTETVELRPISTPQRQLVQLALHYCAHLSDRLFIVKDTCDTSWYSPDTISLAPRALAFVELPSQLEAEQMGLPETKLIPIAAEFGTGEVVLIYEQLRARDGRTPPPPYPESKLGQAVDQLRKDRKQYWQWFDENFSATNAILAVEAAAKNKGRIRWIAYRVPLSNDGDTLHLHCSPGEKYDNGDFAYNFIKRGYKHGLRLVGTLKSEPDMNVLAVFEK